MAGKTEERVPIMGRVPKDMKRSLYHALLDDGTSFNDWLIDKISDYLRGRQKDGDADAEARSTAIKAAAGIGREE